MAYPSLRPPKAPNLIVARPEYDMQQQELFKNQLRLYFNEIDNMGSNLLSGTGGSNLSLPHIAASDSTNQYAVTNTPTIVKFNTLDTGLGFTLNSPGSATANVSGIYKITYSVQLANTDNAAQDATYWLRENGTNIPNSATIFTVPARKTPGNPSFVCAYSEVVFFADAGDIVELVWATTKGAVVSPTADGVYIHAIGAQTMPFIRPAIPSVIGSITFVSRLPS